MPATRWQVGFAGSPPTGPWGASLLKEPEVQGKTGGGPWQILEHLVTKEGTRNPTTLQTRNGSQKTGSDRAALASACFGKKQFQWKGRDGIARRWAQSQIPGAFKETKPEQINSNFTSKHNNNIKYS